MLGSRLQFKIEIAHCCILFTVATYLVMFVAENPLPTIWTAAIFMQKHEQQVF